MKTAQCSKCLKKYYEKDIYTIQQFQYRQEPSYEWTKEFLNILKISEWNPLCEDCAKYYAEISMEAWKKYGKG